MATEVEARFAADGHRPLLELERRATLGPATLREPRAVDEVDRYLDTPSGALAAARWACRLRSRDGRIIVSLKGPAESGDAAWMHRRPEVEGPATAALDPVSWPASDARDLLDRLRGDAPLVERFALRQHRVEREVTRDGRPVGTLSLDTATVVHDGTELGILRVVELELRPLGDGEDVGGAPLGELAAALARVPGLVPEPRTKLERSLALLPRR